MKPLGHFLISNDLEERIQEVKDGLSVLGHGRCPLSNRQNEENTDVDFIRNFASFQNTPLRKGPGFSVLRKPDDMDFS